MSSKQKHHRESMINIALKAMPAHDRPIMSNGFRARSVAAQIAGWLEVSTNYGHTVTVSVKECLTWAGIFTTK